MSEIEYTLVGKGYTDTSEVPKDQGLYYKCSRCGEVIPSIPKDNTACSCDNIYIDIDMWRLDIEDFSRMEVVKQKSV